ncbi:hypothetical protein [Cryptosporangium sp. NPDC048952]|uniref:hypothetical protein n=1 Tax=Cryptosporangium sp. NPDC048952 TaxID=3363961 RepID=UPI0037132547
MTEPEHLYRPELITQGPEWLALRAGMQAAVSAYVTRLRPIPGLCDPSRRDPAELRSRYLLRVAAERAAAEHLDRLAISAGQWAIHYGATPEQLAAVGDTTSDEAAERYAIPEDYRGQKFLPQRPEWAESDAACPGGDQ